MPPGSSAASSHSGERASDVQALAVDGQRAHPTAHGGRPRAQSTRACVERGEAAPSRTADAGEPAAERNPTTVVGGRVDRSGGPGVPGRQLAAIVDERGVTDACGGDDENAPRHDAATLGATVLAHSAERRRRGHGVRGRRGRARVRHTGSWRDVVNALARAGPSSTSALERPVDARPDDVEAGTDLLVRLLNIS